MTDEPRARRKRLAGGSGNEQPVAVSSATLQLFDAADATAATETAADVGKLAGKNPRWLASQEKQRRADVIRERIRDLVADIEAAEEAAAAAAGETEPALKKSWLRARRLELVKALLKQPDEIIESEQLVDKVEQKLQQARRQDGRKAAKAADKKKKRKKKKAGSSSSGESQEESGNDDDDEKADSDGGVEAEDEGGRRARKSGSTARSTEDRPEDAEDEEEEEVRSRAKVPGSAKKGKENRASGLLRLRQLRKQASVDSTEGTRGDGCESGEDEKRSEAGVVRKSKKDKAAKRAKERQASGERSESENEGAARSKWKKPLKKMESVIRLPAKKKGVEKLPKKGVTADRPDDSGSGSGGSWGERVQTREDLLAAESRRRLSASEEAVDVNNCNGVDRLSSSASASEDDDEDNVGGRGGGRGGGRVILEIDAGAAFSDDADAAAGACEVTAIRELPTAGAGKGRGGGLLHRLKRRKEAAARRKAAESAAIADIPVLQQQESSVKQKLRERFSIKSRKPKRSASPDGADGDEVDGRTSSGDRGKVKRENGKGKKRSSKDKDKDKDRARARGVDSDSDEGSGGRGGAREGRRAGPSQTTRNGRTFDHDDDTIHCISLDD